MEWPLTVAALAFLVGYALPILEPTLPPEVALGCRVATWSTWGLFLVDYLARFLLSSARLHFVRTNLLDLAIIGLPLLRPLRLVRLVTLLSVLNRRAATGLRGRIAVYVAGGSLLLAFCGALAVLDAERRSPMSNIVDFGDAMWWAVTTMTTVGYGDRYPVTATGRIVAVALMLGGIALLGVVTATLASWLVQRVAEVEEQSQSDVLAELRELRAEVRRLSDRATTVGCDHEALGERAGL